MPSLTRRDLPSLPAWLAAGLLALAATLLLSAPAWATQADTTMVTGDGTATPLGALALAVLTPVIAWISGKLYDGIKTIIPAFDRLPALVHQVAAPLFGAAFGWLTAATGAELLTDIHGVSAGWIGALLNVLLMAGIKRWEKSKHPSDATVVLAQSRESNADYPMGPSA